MRTFAFSPAFSLYSGDTSTSVAVLWAGGEMTCLKKNLVGLVFIWYCSLTWLTKQLYKWLCHCKEGKGWRYSFVMGKGLLLFTSVLDHTGLLCLLLCPLPNPLRPELTVLLKNLTPFTKKNKNKNKLAKKKQKNLKPPPPSKIKIQYPITCKQDFGYWKFSTGAA